VGCAAVCASHAVKAAVLLVLAAATGLPGFRPLRDDRA
jgi:hypothetical protein